MGKRYIAGAVLAAFATATAMHAAPKPDANERTLTIYNLHTDEWNKATYWRNGKYLPQGVKQINHIMRDFRLDKEKVMDRNLIDTVYKIGEVVKRHHPGLELEFHLVSGYRAPATNNKLRKTRGGQGKKSKHMQGKAFDFTIPGADMEKVRDIASCVNTGGVGWYPHSSPVFVHVDKGKERTWPDNLWTPLSHKKCKELNYLP